MMVPVRATGHLFVITQFERPTQCLHCQNYVFNEQGVKCRCGFVAHKRCRGLVDQLCAESGRLYRAEEKLRSELSEEQLRPNLPSVSVSVSDAVEQGLPPPSAQKLQTHDLNGEPRPVALKPTISTELRSSAPRGSLRRGGMMELHQAARTDALRKAEKPPPAPVKLGNAEEDRH